MSRVIVNQPEADCSCEIDCRAGLRESRSFGEYRWFVSDRSPQAKEDFFSEKPHRQRKSNSLNMVRRTTQLSDVEEDVASPIKIEYRTPFRRAKTHHFG